MFQNSYFTIKENSEAIFKDRGSKFIGNAYRITNEKEIKEILNAIKTVHTSANHHCYAWRIGENYESYRVNDDGEPSNTAGKPIYSVIQSNNLTNVLIVATRYFGGTQLGVPGLINAYKTCAADSIKNTTIIEIQIQLNYQLYFSVDELSNAMRLLKQINATIINQEYTVDNFYSLKFSIEKNKHQLLLSKIENLYALNLKEL